jgi:hypothetical protein
MKIQMVKFNEVWNKHRCHGVEAKVSLKYNDLMDKGKPVT